MPRLTLIYAAGVWVLALVAAIVAAVAAANQFERITLERVHQSLAEEAIDWVQITTDGTQVRLSGLADDEAARFRAIAVASRAVAPDRIVDEIEVRQPEALAGPEFSLEMLRNDDGISLIGLIPEASGRERVLQSIAGLAGQAEITDMLETADHPEPEGWPEALSFSLKALRELPRSKISVTPGKVSVTAITDSPDAKARVESALARARPDGVRLEMNISAPRPVITPFTLRFILDGSGARFDSCSADSEKARERIIRAAVAAGHTGKIDCEIGLGAPSPRWAEAAGLAISAVARLGGGAVTLSDADITLIAAEGTDRALFDDTVHELERLLPDVFSLHAVLPPKIADNGEAVEREAPEFTATLSPEGLVQLRGPVSDARTRKAVAAYARARFGAAAVTDAARVDDGLEDGWPIRILAGIEALGQLRNGRVRVTQESVEIAGESTSRQARTRIAQILSSRLGEDARFAIDVAYRADLDPANRLPTAADCVRLIGDALAERQITFAPSSSTIDADSAATLDRIADIMGTCWVYPMEIGGHTDSQGRESMNLALSQARAEAVLDALLAREVRTKNLSAKGYGESKPIADNGTEEGRAANRRIEFTLTGEADPADVAVAIRDIAEGRVSPPATAPAAAPATGDDATQGSEPAETPPPEEAAPSEEEAAGTAPASGEAPPETAPETTDQTSEENDG